MSTKTLADMAAECGPKPLAPQVGPVSIKDQIEADQRRREKARLQRRAEIRQQIAQRDVLLQQMADLEAQIKQLDARADGLAAEHQSKVAPIQSMEGATGEARTKLLEKLTAANIELEQQLAVVNRCREPLQKEHWRVRNVELGKMPTEQRLAGDDLSSPPLRVEKFVLERRSAAAQARLEAANDMLSQIEPMLHSARTTKFRPESNGWTQTEGRFAIDFKLVHDLTHRLNKWKAELLDAESEMAACQAELVELVQRAIAE